MMTNEKIQASVNEAKRFIAAADALEKRRNMEELYHWQGCKESGALRRSSLDLTRSLAELRS